MTLTDIYGRSPLDIDLPNWNAGVPSFSTLGVLAATATKFAMLGYVWKPTRPAGTFNIRKVHFRTGTVSIAPASAIRVSLQDVSATAGPPYEPDGTQDQTVDISGASLASNTWTTTGNLSADRSVSQGSLIAVVWEFQTFTALDSVIISMVNPGTTPDSTLLSGLPVLNVASYVAQLGLNNLVLECDDGTYAFLDNCFPYSALSSVSVATNITARAAGNYFSVPVSCKIDRLALKIAIPNSCDGSFILYDGDGTTALLTVGIDNDAVASTAARDGIVTFPPITLAVSTGYRFAFVPSTTTAATVYFGDVSVAAMMDSLPWGSQCMYTQRDSVGAWAQTTTRRCHWGMGLSAVQDGAGGSGGMLVHPGMAGGARG